MAWRDVIGIYKLIQKNILDVFETKSNVIDKDIQQANANKLDTAVRESFTNLKYGTKDHALAVQLRHNVHVFSVFKQYHNQTEVVSLLLDENGKRRTFEQFKSVATPVIDKFNKSHLRTEYDTASSTARMASKWIEYTKNDPNQLLKYVAINDGKTRRTHQLLHGTTLPASDPFWQQNLPPIDWNCRCNVVRAPSTATIKQPDELIDLKPLFAHNAGIDGKIFTDAHPYFSYQPEDEAYLLKYLESLPVDSKLKYEEKLALYKQYIADTEHELIHTNVLTNGFLFKNKKAYKSDVKDNILIGKILADNGYPVSINKHILNGNKNPEYTIYNITSDLKTPEKITSVKNGFNKATAQEITHFVCNLIEIDKIDIDILTEQIRRGFFYNSTIEKVIFVFKKQTFEISNTDFKDGKIKNILELSIKKAT